MVPNTNKHIPYREQKNCASEAFVLPVWNVFVGVRVNVFFGKAEVDNVDDFVKGLRSYQGPQAG